MVGNICGNNCSDIHRSNPIILLIPADSGKKEKSSTRLQKRWKYGARININSKKGISQYHFFFFPIKIDLNKEVKASFGKQSEVTTECWAFTGQSITGKLTGKIMKKLDGQKILIRPSAFCC